MSGAIRREEAVVYRTEDGRRFFTLKAAINRAARMMIQRKYPCECENRDYHTGYPGHVCEARPGNEFFDRRHRRLVRRMRRRIL